MNISFTYRHRFFLLNIIIGFLVIISSHSIFAETKSRSDNNTQKAILVTGASTGLGR